MTRRIAALTTSRADFGHLYWPLRELDRCPEIELSLIAIAAHLSPEFGTTVREIEAAGLRVDETVECLMSSDTDVGMAKTIGVATLGLTDVLARMRPDLLLLIADRYEMLAPATVALALRIPIAHIEGGEVSEGAVDDAVRNALTKMSHVHFTPTRSALRRVLAMGEEPWRVHRSGAPSLDHLRRTELPDRAALETELGIALDGRAVLVAYHPVTLARDTLIEADEMFAALERLDRTVLFCFPNADAGSRDLIDRAKHFAAQHADSRVFVNLSPTSYWGLLHHVAMLLGNSSSGIMETASLELPTVNVGVRQKGRERAANVIDSSPAADDVVSAVRRGLDPAFRAGLEGMTNPYGDGHAAELIRDVLRDVPLGEELLVKRAMPLPGGA